MVGQIDKDHFESDAFLRLDSAGGSRHYENKRKQEADFKHLMLYICIEEQLWQCEDLLWSLVGKNVFMKFEADGTTLHCVFALLPAQLFQLCNKGWQATTKDSDISYTILQCFLLRVTQNRRQIGTANGVHLFCKLPGLAENIFYFQSTRILVLLA